MFKDLRVRAGLIAAIVLLSAWLIFDRGITLGLDLQGGTHLALEVQDPDNALTADQRAEATDRALQVIRTRVDELGVAEPNIQRSGADRIVVELPGATAEEQQRAKDVIQRSAFLQFQIVRPMSDFTTPLQRMDRAIAAAGGTPAAPVTAPDSAPATPGLDIFQTAPDSAATDSLAADSAALASTDTTNSAQPFSSLLSPGSAGAEAIFLIANENVATVERYIAMPEVQQLVPRGLVLRWGLDQDAQLSGFRSLYLLEREPLITGEYLVDAQAQRDQLGQPIVIFEFNRQGGRIFERGTGANVGNLMAIVLDERVFSAPIIQSQIGTRGQIEMGGGTIEAASDLALVLRAGALPAPIEIVYESAIGPSLGADSINAGRLAGIVGILAVIVMIVAYYRFSGLLAVAGLAVYVLLLLGAMASVDAALTFPGIAGLVLSIGMALDANVLIFERIREELAAGHPIRRAIDAGFSNAMSAIIDGHVTTIISSLILYRIGTGPVRGFAVTLGIGVAASLFSAVFVVRTLFMLYIKQRGDRTQTLSI
jgi:protein-export membrane protein SecD